MKKYKFLLSLIIILSIICTSGCSKQEEVKVVEETVSSVAQETEFEVDESEKMHVYFLDLKENDSTFIVLPNGTNFLIDAGNEDDVENVLSTLEKLGAKNIDYLIGTHAEESNIGSFKQILETMPVSNIYLTNSTNSTETLSELTQYLKEQEIEYFLPAVGETIYSNFETRLSVIAPNSSYYKNINNSSMVLKLLYKDKTFLFQGDAGKISENEILETGVDIDCDVIRIANHGLDTGTTESYIKAVTPIYAIISSSYEEDETKPNESVKKILRDNNVKVYETGLYGNIHISTDGDTIDLVYDGNSDAPPTMHNSKDASYQPEKIEDFHSYTTFEEKVYITNEEKIYHSSDCEKLSEYDSYSVLTITEALEEEYEPCAICQ